jgi:hypothetical protein
MRSAITVDAYPPFGSGLLAVANFLVSFILIAALFAAIYHNVRGRLFLCAEPSASIRLGAADDHWADPRNPSANKLSPPAPAEGCSALNASRINSP